MAGKKGAKKTVGKTRKGDAVRQIMKLYYVQKSTGVYAPRYEALPTPESAEEPQPEAE